MIKTMTYKISTQAHYWGDATENEAQAAAELLAERAAAEFPGVEFEVTAGESGPADGDDEAASEIHNWINENWADIAGEAIDALNA